MISFFTFKILVHRNRIYGELYTWLCSPCLQLHILKILSKNLHTENILVGDGLIQFNVDIELKSNDSLKIVI